MATVDPGTGSDRAGVGTATEETGREAEAGEVWGWTRAHRVGLGVLLTLFLVFLVILYVQRPVRLDDPVVVHEGEVLELEQAVDPNVAGVAALMRVPGMTRRAAEAIVEYRESRRSGAGEVVFQNAEDLGQVKVGRGRIAKGTLEGWRSFLRFPGDATQPAAGHGLVGPRVVTTGEGEEEGEE